MLGLEPTGVYDDKTKKAVKDLQEKLGVTADGIYGSETASALEKALTQGDISNSTQTIPTVITSPPTSSTGNGNPRETGETDSKGEKIICVELFRQGLMDKNIYEADEAFGELLNFRTLKTSSNAHKH